MTQLGLYCCQRTYNDIADDFMSSDTLWEEHRNKRDAGDTILHLNGYMNKEIAGMVGLWQHTVGYYISAYKAEGIAGLEMGKSTGAPRFLTTEQEQQLFSVITTKTPDQAGIPNRKNWDTPAARLWVKKNFAVEYSARGMLKVLHRLNLSYTRPTYTLACRLIAPSLIWLKDYDDGWKMK